MDQFEICQQHNSEFTAYDSNRNELLCNGWLFTIQRLEEHILPLWEVVRRTKNELDSSFTRYFRSYEKARSISADRIIEQKSSDVDGLFKDILGQAEQIKQIASQKAENSVHIQQMKQKVATNQELNTRLIESRFKEKENFDKWLEQRKYLYIVKRKQHYEQHLNEINHSGKVLAQIEKEVQSEMKDVAVVNYKKDLVESAISQIVESQIEIDDSNSIPVYNSIMKPQLDTVPISHPLSHQNLVKPHNYLVQSNQLANSGFRRQQIFQESNNAGFNDQNKEGQQNQSQGPSLIDLASKANIDNWEKVLEKITAMKQAGYRPAATKEALRNSCFTPLSDMMNASKVPEPQENWEGRISPSKQQQEEYFSESTLCENQEGIEKSFGEELQHLWQDNSEGTKLADIQATSSYSSQQQMNNTGKLNLLASIFPNDFKNTETDKKFELPKPSPRISLIPLQSNAPQQSPTNIKFGFNKVN